MHISNTIVVLKANRISYIILKLLDFICKLLKL